MQSLAIDLERELHLKDQKIAELEQAAFTQLRLLVDVTQQCGRAMGRAESLQAKVAELEQRLAAQIQTGEAP